MTWIWQYFFQITIQLWFGELTRKKWNENQANVSQFNFPYNMFHTKEVLWMLQETLLHVAMSSRNLQCFQKTCYSLRQQLEMVYKALQSSQKLELSSTANVTECKSLCNLCCNGVVRDVARWLQHVTYPLSYLSDSIFRLAMIAQSRAWFCIL